MWSKMLLQETGELAGEFLGAQARSQYGNVLPVGHLDHQFRRLEALGDNYTGNIERTHCLDVSFKFTPGQVLQIRDLRLSENEHPVVSEFPGKTTEYEPRPADLMIDNQALEGMLVGEKAELEFFFLPGIELGYFNSFFHNHTRYKQGLKQSRGFLV